MTISELDRKLDSLNKNLIMAIGIFLCLLLGWAGFFADVEFSFAVFYIVPVVLVAWYCGLKNGQAISLLSALAWLAGDLLSGRSASLEVMSFVNAFSRAFIYMLISTLVSMVKKHLGREIKFANEDFLTKISNSRGFFNYISMEIERLKRYAEPFTLAYFDVDNFKAVNDNYGHNAGDALLVDLARTIRKHIRPTDMVARLGGDEFAVLLLETDPAQAHEAMGSLQKRMKESMKDKNKDITFSFGVVTFLKAPASIDAMIKKADDMMYLSKNGGKDAINYFVYR